MKKIITILLGLVCLAAQASNWGSNGVFDERDTVNNGDEPVLTYYIDDEEDFLEFIEAARENVSAKAILGHGIELDKKNTIEPLRVGSGTNAPKKTYNIYDEEDLIEFIEAARKDGSVNAKVINHIQCNPQNAIEPLRGFSGTFDGNNKTISGLFLVSEIYPSSGLFGALSGEIKNCRFESCNIGVASAFLTDFGNYVGFICSENRGVIRNCELVDVKVAVMGDADASSRGENFYHMARIGGICGSNGGSIYNSNISNLIFHIVNMSQQVECGGIVGDNSGVVSGCNNTSAIKVNLSRDTPDYQAFGGIVAVNLSGGIINKCANYGDYNVSGTISGGICADMSSGKILNSYTLTDNIVGEKSGGTLQNNYDLSEYYESDFTNGKIACLLRTNNVSCSNDTENNTVDWGWSGGSNYPELGATASKVCLEVTKIKVYGNPTENLTYGTSWDPYENLRVRAYYDDGSDEYVDGWSISPRFKSTRIGTQTYTVSYEGVESSSFNITVMAEPEPYAVFENGTLTLYYDGNKPDSWYNLGGWEYISSDITKVVFDKSFGDYRPTSCRVWFDDCENLTEIVGMKEYLHTDDVTDMLGMFRNCKSLTNLDVSGFRTGNVTEMHGMFSGCANITSLDVSGFDTKNATDISWMFRGCASLTDLDVSGFRTENVTDIRSMFEGCSGLTSLDVSGFQTGNVTDMNSMFSGCSGLTSLDVSSFDTRSVEHIAAMFENCSGLTSLDVSGFQTGNIVYMNSMFAGCTGLTALDVSNFNTENVQQMGSMFANCTGLTSLGVSNFDTKNVSDITDMFANCSGLTNLDLSNFNTGKVNNMNRMFSGCSALKSINVENFNTENVEDMVAMFSGCTNLERIDISSFNTSKLDNASDMFRNCRNLKCICVGEGWTTTSLTHSNYMFSGCKAIVGGHGTVYNSNYTDATYARIDGGEDAPGYFTKKGVYVIDKISVGTNPEKTQYFVGEDIDLSGLVLTVSYYGGITENIDFDGENVSIENFDNTTAGTRPVTISYKGKETTFDVTFQEPTISGISIMQNPTRNQYYVGEPIDLSGLVVVAKYDNGDRLIDNADIEIADFDNNTPGFQTITIAYKGQSASFMVLFIQPEVEEISSVESLPNKLDYNVGEDVDLDGLVLNVKYSDGTIQPIAYNDNNMEIVGSYDNTTPGKREITVSYQGQNMTLEVEYKAQVNAASIVITQRPIKLEYWRGEDIDYFGLIVTAKGSDGSEKDVAISDCIISGYDGNVVGEQTITVSYNGNAATFPVRVKEWVFVSVGVYQMPYKLEYKKGDTFDPDGFSVEFNYSNGEKKYLDFDPFKCFVSGFEADQLGIQNVTMMCYEETQDTYVAVNFSVIVKDDNAVVNVDGIKSITIDRKPYNETYTQGDVLNTYGLKVTAVYTNGNTESVSVDDCIIYGYNMDKVGKQNVSVSYAGKVATFEITVNKKPVALESIVVSQRPIKLEYNKGDNIDYDGLAVTARNTDGSEMDVTNECTLSGYNKNIVGKQKITVSYQGKTATFMVAVKEVALVSFEVENTPEKVTYYKGESFEKYGFSGILKYSNGNKETVSQWDVTFSTPDMDKIGPQKVTVTYGDNSAYFYITVNDIAVESIVVSHEPYKTSYTEGEDIATNGLQISALYTNGTSQNVDIAACIMYGYDMNKIGKQNVIVSFSGKSATFEITVEPKAVELESIVVSQRPIKLEYQQGDDIIFDGLSVIAKYSDGSEKDVTSECTKNGYDKDVIGIQQITISYNGKTATFPVEVKAVDIVVESITIDNEPYKTNYIVGDILDTDGLKVSAIYNNGNTESVAISDCIIFGYDMAKIGKQNVVVDYKDKKATFEISVGEKEVVLESIVVSQRPIKLEYWQGEDIQYDGLVVTAKYSDGSDKVVTDDSRISGYNSNVIGKQEISIDYNGKTATFPVEVKDIALLSFEIVNTPDKVTYYKGDRFETYGFKAKANYSNGKIENLSQSDVTFTMPNMDISGEQKVTVTYSDQSAYFYITINKIDIETIVIDRVPNKTSYLIGDELSTEGMKVSAVYNNGNTETVDVSDCSIYGYNMNTTGSQNVMIGYNGKTATFEISVAAKTAVLESISVAHRPNKLEYWQEEEMEIDGMSVIAKYSDGSEDNVSEDCSISGYNANVVGKQTITVSYKGKSDTFVVSVKEWILISMEIETLPAKIEYYKGENFDANGFKGKLNYSNGKSKSVGYSECTFDGYNMNKAGEQKVKVSYSGKTDYFYIAVNNAEISNIQITKLPSKTSYFVGDDFAPFGLKIKAEMSNGEEFDVPTSACDLDGFDMEKTGRQTVVVSYGGKETSFEITVAEIPSDLESIVITKTPDKTTYWRGEDFISDGLTVTAMFTDGRETVVTSECELEGYDNTIVGSQNIIVKYSDKFANFSVVVKEWVLQSLDVKTSPNKTEYVQGDVFEEYGFKGILTYTNGKTETVDDYDCKFSKPDMNSIGEQEVTVRYKDKETSFTIVVKEKEQKLESISITKNPAKTEYDRGEDIDYSGLVVTAQYSDGSQQIVTDKCFMEGYNKDASGVQKVAITYTEGDIVKADTLHVSVKELVLAKIEINSMPDKTTYQIGEKFDQSGFEALFIYTNGQTEVKTLADCDFLFFGAKDIDLDCLTEIGTQTIMAFYNGQTVSFQIEVVNNDEIISLNISNCKNYYFINDVFDAEGIKIEALKKNGDTEEVLASNCSFYGYDMNRLGKQTVVVNYKGITETYQIEVVEAELVSLKIVSLPLKTNYLMDETFDYNGLRVVANYVNGAKEIYDYDIKEPETKVLGDNTITVAYEGKQASFVMTISNVVLDKIEIVQTPFKLDYYVNEVIDYSGLEIAAVYSDGSRTPIDHSKCEKSGFDMTTAGLQTVVVSYEDNSVVYDATFNIRVKNITLKSIFISQSPTKKDYYYEDKALDLAGMTVKAIYSDGNIEVLDNLECQYEGFDPTAYGVSQPITVQYEDMTDVFFINIHKLKSVNVKYEASSNSGIISVMDLAVSALYSDGTEHNVDNYNYVYLNEKSVSITYGDFEIEYTLKDDEQPTVTSKKGGSARVEVKIWSYDGIIIVENATSEILIADINGHIIRRVEHPNPVREEIHISKSGIYVVRTGDANQTLSL